MSVSTYVGRHEMVKSRLYYIQSKSQIFNPDKPAVIDVFLWLLRLIPCL